MLLSILQRVLLFNAGVLEWFTDLSHSLVDWLFRKQADLEEKACLWIQDYLEDETGNEEAEVLAFNPSRRPRRFARFLGKRAYLQFGHREKTKADMLMTRKWLRNLVQKEYASLRVQQQIETIDEALFLSYIPTERFVECSDMADTESYKELLPGGSIPL
jgi:hypothetical protein